MDDLPDLSLSELGPAVSFSSAIGVPPAFEPCGRTMTHGIPRVRRLCIPPQVLKSIVRRIAVVVATLHSLGTGTYESFEDEAMDVIATLWITASLQQYRDVTTFRALHR